MADTYESTQTLINKAIGRNSLRRHEQRQLGLLLKDKVNQCSYQANIIRQLRDEIIRIKIERGHENRPE